MEGLSAICAGLGIIDEDDDGNRIGYVPGEYCLDNLKDLLRFLRRDDQQTREVFKQVCKWNIVGKDLIPIIEHCQNDRNLVLNSVKVLVFLTMPIEPGSNDIPQQIEYLWGLKSLITCSDIVAIIFSLLETPLENLESEAFTEDDWKLVQLVLTLFRNLLAVQGVSLQQKLGGSASQFLSVRDRFLELLFRENVTDLILALTQHVGGPCGYFRQDNLLLLETLHYLFNGQEPELIAEANSKDSQVDAEATVSSLQSLMEEEEEKRRLIRLRNLGIYSQFGTFTRFTMDGSKALIKGNPCSASHDVLLKTHKNHQGPAKRMAWDHGKLPSTNDTILQLLHDFINQFLSGGYNVLMQSVREDIEKEHHAIQSSDVVIFFKVAQFITSFQYQKFLVLKPSFEGDASEASINHSDNTLFQGSICGPIAETLNESMFFLVTSKWRYAFDGLKETNDHNFLSAAGSLMRIMIRMLDMVLKRSKEDSMEPQTARILLYKLFYDQTDQGMTHFILNLIKSFDTHKQARSDLSDLLEMIHVIIRLMENLQARGTLRVSKKSRKRRTKKTFQDENDTVNKTVGNHVSPQDDMGTSSCAVPIDSSNSETVSTNQAVDQNENVTVPLPVNKDDTPDLEAEIPGSNMPEVEGSKVDNVAEDYGADDSSDGEQLGQIDEVDFKTSTLVSALANTTIIQKLCWLLKFYKSNSSSTNHYIVCMLRRICDDLELSPMLYQLSLLTTFHGILEEQTSSPNKEYKNIVDFLTSLVRRMLRKMKTYPLLFLEVLFWKTRKECHYINCESMINDLTKWKKEDNKQGHTSVHEVDGSSGGKGWTRRSIADALGDDEADFTLFHEINDQNEKNPHKTEVNRVLKRSINSVEEANGSVTPTSDEGSSLKKNIKDGRHSAGHQPGKLHKRTKALHVDEELDKEIKDLYEKYKDEENCIHLIVEGLDLDGKISSREVSRKLKQFGFKFPHKRRLPGTGVSNQLGEEARILGSEDAHHNLHDSQENNSVRRSLHTRKRVRAFSEEQESMIKGLFEQFKDHKRCSFMIANALDASGTFTTTQISRKLKQLGLRVPQPKRLNTHLHLRDEDPDDISDEGVDDTETLSSLRKRTKTKQNNMAERPDEETAEKVAQEDSDDELLSSILGNKHEQPSETGDMVDDPILDKDDDVETKANDVSMENTASTLNMDGQLYHQDLHDELGDELADFRDDVTPVESQKLTGSRRKLRMVLDFDDD